MARKSNAARKPQPAEDETQDPSLPEVLISPTQAKPSQRDAYWLELADDPQKFAAAIKNDEFNNLLAILPKALWGQTLRLYLYRKPADDGVMVLNSADDYKYAAVFYKPVPLQHIKEKWGGGKYQWWLNWCAGDQDKTIRKSTFEIDGPPIVQDGQTVQVDGKVVSVAGAAQPTAPPTDARSDIATVIEAASEANKQSMELVTHAAKAGMDIMKERAIGENAPQKDSITSAIELVTALKALMPAPTPQPNMLELIAQVKEIFVPNPQPEPEPKDPPITEAMGLVEKFTGKTFAEMLEGRGRSNPNGNGQGEWSFLAPVAQEFVRTLPGLLHEFRVSKEMEFRRAVWLRTAQTGEKPPIELLNPPPQPTATPAPRPPQPTATPAPTNQQELAGAIVQIICQRFDKFHDFGYATGGVIDGLYGEQIDSSGLGAMLSNEATVRELLKSEGKDAHPAFVQRAQDARWVNFVEDLIAYIMERWGTDEPDESEEPAQATGNGPQPVAP